MSNQTNAIQRHLVLTFYILAFTISWLGWVPQALHARRLFLVDTTFFSFSGGAGPTLAAVILLLILGEKDGLKKLFGALLQMKGL